MKFFLLINVKMPTVVGILTFISGENSILGLSEPNKCRISWYFYTYEHSKFHAQLSWAWKKFYNLGACCRHQHKSLPLLRSISILSFMWTCPITLSFKYNRVIFPTIVQATFKRVEGGCFYYSFWQAIPGVNHPVWETICTQIQSWPFCITWRHGL